MARLLILNEYLPEDLTSGRDLRVSRLCAELVQRHDCFFISFARQDRGDFTPAEPIGFRDALELDDFRVSRKSMWRHFRLSNFDYMKKAWPGPFQQASATVKKMEQHWNVDAVVNFTAGLSALALPLSVPKLLDRTDCDTLMLERRLANRGSRMSLREKTATRLEWVRERRRERALVNAYDVVTTIAEPDRQKFLEIGRCSPDRIRVVQNGVSELALHYGERREPAGRSVVFWGNMDFAPNWTAVDYFYRHVFKPYLDGQGIDFYIIGRGGNQPLKELSNDPSVKRLGFVPELFECLADKAVMVNPMVEGSGLKNKVLEAFALRLPVVSTSLGVDALPVQAGVHLQIADDEQSFARSILKLLDEAQYAGSVAETARQFVEQQYGWQRIGQQFAAIVSDFVAARAFRNDGTVAPAMVDQ